MGGSPFYPKIFCVAILSVLSYQFHLMKFRLFKVACTLLTGRYVGSRPIKLRKSTWKQRNIDTVRKKEKEKTALIGLLTGRWPKSDCGELLMLLILPCVHFVSVFKADVQNKVVWHSDVMPSVRISPLLITPELNSCFLWNAWRKSYHEKVAPNGGVCSLCPGLMFVIE